MLREYFVRFARAARTSEGGVAIKERPISQPAKSLASGLARGELILPGGIDEVADQLKSTFGISEVDALAREK
jgi:hypothetical protein